MTQGYKDGYKIGPWDAWKPAAQPVAQSAAQAVAQPVAQPAQASAVPLWARAGSTLPRPPFLDALAGDRSSAFRPGGLQEIPSAQRYNRLAPTEQQATQSYFRDELGVPWEDVAGWMQRLRPQGFSALPRWSMGGF